MYLYQPVLCVSLNKSIPNAPPYIPRISVNNLLQCNQIVGYLAAYRVCMAVAGFFLLLTGIMICVKSSKDPRAYLQNGFWLFKWLFVIGITVGFFFIPDGSNFIFSRGKKLAPKADLGTLFLSPVNLFFSFNGHRNDRFRLVHCVPDHLPGRFFS